MAHPATVIVRREEADTLPRAAVAYGIKELARRAGVRAELFRTWNIKFESSGIVSIFVQPGTNKCIQFARMTRATWSQILDGVFRTSTAEWMRAPSDVRAFASALKIPFSSNHQEFVGPLFSQRQHDCIECPVDLPASVVLTLGRFEETLPGPRDQHGRFSAFSSIAWREGFLHRPIVDEYGLAFAQALSCLLPAWQPAEKRLRVKLGHDVDDTGAPFLLRSTIAHAVNRGRPLAMLRDLVAAPGGMETAYQALLRRIVMLSLDCGLDAAVYWKASAPGPYDRGYQLQDKRNLALKKALRSRGVEMGIHPSYRTFNSEANFRKELALVRQWLGESELGGRQDYLRWNPETWLLWESLGMAYDASVGYADYVGFRAGTCYPYKPWLFSQQREANLLEIPLLAMDTTLLRYMNLQPEQALSKLLDLVDRCRAVGGVFTLVWHQTNLMKRDHASVYCRLLNHLIASDSFDWRNLHHGAN